MFSEPTYMDIVSMPLLKKAWLQVKSKSSMGGIDGEDIKSFEQNEETNLSDILFDLQNEKVKPYPYQKISIPKSDGSLRILGLLSIKDKIIQGALKQLIEPLFESQFLDISYAYRADKGHVKAIRRILHILNTAKPKWVISCDIKNFFDNVDHTILYKLVSNTIKDEKLLHLIKLSYIMGRVDKKGNWVESKTGVPQGGILSPLLSNIYLHQFDVAINGPNSLVVRYADDFIIFCPNSDLATNTFEKTKEILEQDLKLTIKPGYTISDINDGFTFLGISFIGNGISIAPQKVQSMTQSLASMPVLNNHEIHKKFEEKLMGYRNYYGKLLNDSELLKIDKIIFECISKALIRAFELKIITKTVAKSIFNSISYLSFEFSKNIQLLIKIELLKPEWQPTKPKPKERKIPLEVLQRKREYQHLQSQGMDLVIIKPGCFISKTKQNVTVKYSGKTITEISTSNLRSISITTSGISITSNLIEHCMEQAISIDFFDYKGNPYAKIFAPDQYSIKNGLAQLEAFKNKKAESFCKNLIQSKIYNQTAYIKYHSKYRKNLSKEWKKLLLTTITKMDIIALSIEKIEYENIEELRGKILAAEGRAASCYWAIIESIVKPKIVSFEGRVRKGANDLFNSMLNYGYSILYARLWACIVRSGLNPGISYLHTEQHNKPTLVYDLIEQFRVQAVDKPLVAMAIKEENLKIDKTGYLTEETKKRVVQKILERINSFEMFRGKEMRLIDIFQRQTDDFQKYLIGEIKTYKPYLMKW